MDSLPFSHNKKQYQLFPDQSIPDDKAPNKRGTFQMLEQRLGLGMKKCGKMEVNPFHPARKIESRERLNGQQESNESVAVPEKTSRLKKECDMK